MLRRQKHVLSQSTTPFACTLVCVYESQEKQESPPCKGSGMEVVWPSCGSSVDFFRVEDILVLPLVFGTGPQAAVASLILECSS